MYGLPNDFNASRFIGYALELVCFSQNQVCFHFNERVSIVVLNELLHQYSSDALPKTIRIPVVESDLMRLLGHSIVQASGNEKGTLAITFDSGDILQFLDDSAHYESYTITFGDEEITV